ncbi:hypothetical protein VQL36_04395 [Chengkuizengella sp. SCS-71B]|uniref:hypothetical protein n=1 Tax=Chengkuizengella sp. SCS-71B TaxID=3115290 RepID=UPI0032C22CAA
MEGTKNKDQRIQLHPLTFLDQKEGVLIGRFGTDLFALFPEDGANLVKQLQAGVTMKEAIDWYEQTYQEEIDIDDFLQTLNELQFINEEKGEEEVIQKEKIAWQRAGQYAFSPWAFILYASIVLSCILFIFNNPRVIPQREHILFSEYSVVITLGILFGQLPGLFIHESMHYLAGRRLGLPSKFGIGYRMYFLVFTTSMPGIWGIPKKNRYLPFLAGMLGDILWYSFLVIIAGLLYIKTGAIEGFGAFCLALAMTTFLRLIWQFYFHLQTDIYYIMISILDCINLQEITRKYVKYSWYRLIRSGKTINFDKYTERDLKVARWYSIFYSIGWAFMVGILVYLLPVAIKFLSSVFVNLYKGEVYVLDSVIFLLLFGIELGAVLYLFFRGRRNIRKRSGVSV